MPSISEAPVVFRLAQRPDLPAIVRLLAEDAIGSERDEYQEPLFEGYGLGFETINQDANNELIVAELNGQICGVLQLTFIPGITYRGAWRAQIEGVRVAAGQRKMGIGRHMVNWAIERSTARGCRLVQLTTDKRRSDARVFYESLGFKSSHDGMKLDLSK